ncbi:unnamed protein product [Linum tenue]|uniref:Uncharacterized protein n=1 Tax=Linum tenue TaxID=586396 RepID=A0AAV0K2R8_9ROSI|nr:unnamed protein product [Linum tenue]
MAAAKHSQIPTICSLLLLCAILPLMAAAAAQQRKPSVAVEGVVYCLSCKYAGSGSLIDATPIKSANVSVSCANSGVYQINQTDVHGYFYSWLDGPKLGRGSLGNPIQACTVKLVSSPLEACNVPTDLNHGNDGAKLRFEGKVVKSPHYAVFYAAGPLAFRPQMCAN